MESGDSTVELGESLFIHGEACEVTGLDSKTLNNWVQREIIPLGKMHRSGRRLYSVIDLVKLQVIADITRLQVRPSVAISIAESVMPRVDELIEFHGEYQVRHADPTNEPQFLVAWMQPDGDTFTVLRVKESQVVKNVGSSRPAIVIPLDAIALTVALKVSRILRREKRS